eukprot:5945901-Prymnesium_polylepis.1
MAACATRTCCAAHRNPAAPAAPATPAAPAPATTASSCCRPCGRRTRRGSSSAPSGWRGGSRRRSPSGSGCWSI